MVSEFKELNLNRALINAFLDSLFFCKEFLYPDERGKLSSEPLLHCENCDPQTAVVASFGYSASWKRYHCFCGL